MEWSRKPLAQQLSIITKYSDFLQDANENVKQIQLFFFHIPDSEDLLSELAARTSVCRFGGASWGSNGLRGAIISGGGEVTVVGLGCWGAAWDCVSLKVSTAPRWPWEKDSRDCMAPVKVSWCLTSWRTHFDRPERRGHQRLTNI